MASLNKLCTESPLRMKLYRLVLLASKFVRYPSTVILPFKFSSTTLKFAIPVGYLNAALNNAEHVLVNCDYYKFDKAVPKSGSTVVDAGAFIGFYTVASSTLVGVNGHVYAIEPNHSVVSYLDLNLKLNKSPNTWVYPVALCPEHGWARLYVGEYPSVSSLLREHVENYTTVRSVREVKCLKLSSLLGYLGSVDVLKLDIEGVEQEVLTEAFEQLKHVKSLIVEVHKDAVEPRDIEDLLLKSGFGRIVIYTSHETPWQLIIYAFRA